MRRRSDDPIAGLSRRERWSWLRRERAIVASHAAGLTAALGGLIGAPVLSVRAEPAGTVTLTLPGWRVGVAGVSASAVAALTSRVRQTCHVAGGGRYGRFWWLAVAVTADPAAAPAVVLGAAARLQPAGGGRRAPSPPGLIPRGGSRENGSLTTRPAVRLPISPLFRATRKEYSLS